MATANPLNIKHKQGQGSWDSPSIDSPSKSNQLPDDGGRDDDLKI